MKNIYILLFFFLCCSNMINICDAASKLKTIESNNKFRKKINKNNLTKRKLDDFTQLKIKLDTAEMDQPACNPLSRYLVNIKSAMIQAKDILEENILISPDTAGITLYTVNDDGVINDRLKDEYGIDHHDTLFNSEFYLTDNNYFIFGKCVNENLNEGIASVILEFQSMVPYMGLILFNTKDEYVNNIVESKFSVNYLTNVMLHHFIKLLGFNAALTDPAINYIPSYYLKTESSYDFDNVIEYAKAYTGCDTINRIDLYVDDENLCDSDYCEYEGIEIIGLYWPKALFSGEILTKFDYPEVPFISGFTWAFLDDLTYLKVTKDYKGDLTGFGEYSGCLPICDKFNTDVDHFWDCHSCRGGYFKAMKGSSESETTCINNNNKDYYFLYNQDLEIYRKCEFEISNCLKCSSQTQCTSCFNGFLLEQENSKSICKKEEKEEEDDGLSTGAIVGIVFGCIGFLLLVALIIFCLITRKKEKKEEKPEKKIIETAKEEVKDPLEDDIKVIEYDKKS